MCPGGPNSGSQHASGCRFDRLTGQVQCFCLKGYAGMGLADVNCAASLICLVFLFVFVFVYIFFCIWLLIILLYH